MSSGRPGLRAHWDLHGPAPGSKAEQLAQLLQQNSTAMRRLAHAMAPVNAAAAGRALACVMAKMGITAAQAARNFNRAQKAAAKVLGKPPPGT